MNSNPKRNRRSVRLSGFNYGSDGAYFITICSFERKSVFGEIFNGRMLLSALGRVAYEEWLKTPQIREYVSLGKFVIMPNHMHAIILIHKKGAASNMPPTAAVFATVVTGVYRNKFGPQKENLASVIRGYKSAVTTKARQNGNEEKIWQSRYHEHIIRNQDELERIEKYIEENPQNWNTDRFR